MSLTDDYFFNHEKLEVYKQSIEFIAWLSPVLDNNPKLGEIKDQLDRASISVPLNIAEGNGKFTPKDRCRYFDTAHGSSLECSAGLDVLIAKGKISREQAATGKHLLQANVRMPIGLIKANSTRDYSKSNQD